MSIYTDIQKVTQIPETNESSYVEKFICRKEATRNQQLKKPKSPENVDVNSSSQEFNGLPQEYYLHEHEIACSVREANDGISYSNENFEVVWKARQLEARNSKSKILEKEASSIKSVYDNNNLAKEIGNEISELSNGTNERKCIEDEESILKQCRLNKNAVIRGLLRNHTISLKDLCMPNDYIDLQHKNSTSVQQKNFMKLVQCPEDPEVFVQPLQAHGTIDENEYKDIDFSVPHVGKKRKVTSRQFFINMDDSDFDFVKTDAKIKN
ncbi:hypothetical protein WH47_09987 [Habropoda laboriosa]|uniref:Uncharacterized protein n=1 Tax=Habropoda laboriosa TaxID=597456 RepID=A0A0L7R3J9_9HYME|nr:PREDICTED: uncharacterized protein LOC108572245 [Habropoda laboriosa]KOC65408.1 hypothetical protein WH47_09987 [Habropoda laboriosa]